MVTKDDFLKLLSADLGLMPDRIEHIIKTAPLRYKKFKIPKRDGTSRTVAQPAREVKAIQRLLVKKLALPVHSAATAYKAGSSIKINAKCHISNNFLLKMDFRNFFPSIYFEDIAKHIERVLPGTYDLEVRELIARACTWTSNRKPPLRLCIGAPSSPAISNSILYEFDTLLSGITAEKGVVYTRYADDLTFSASEKNVLEKFPKLVLGLINDLEYPRLKVNQSKTVFASKAGNRTVTGITLNSVDELSVGRDRKRLISAMYHNYHFGKLSEKEIQRLFGLLAFVDSIEPGFSARLKLKYRHK